MIERRRRELIGRHFGALLAEGRREGLVRKDISVPLILEILLGTVQAIMNPPKMAELGLTPKSGLTALLTVVLEGVITSQGRSRLTARPERATRQRRTNDDINKEQDHGRRSPHADGGRENLPGAGLADRAEGRPRRVAHTDLRAYKVQVKDEIALVEALLAKVQKAT